MRIGTLRCRLESELLKLIVGFFVAVIIFQACSRTSEYTSNIKPATPATVVPDVRLVDGDERKRVVLTHTKGLVQERDKIEKISFYSAGRPVYSRPGIDAYISLPDNMLPLLRMKPIYFGDNWIFYETVKIMVDDSVVYERSFKRSDIVRDNSAGSVWETADFVAKEPEVAVLKAIAASKSATIRFSGDERRYDHEVTSKERRDIKKILDAYEKLSSDLVRKDPTTKA